MTKRNFGLSFEKLTADTSARDPSNVILFPLALSPDAMENLRGGEETVSSFIQDEREFGAIALVVAFLAMIGFTFFALIFFAFALFDFG